MPMNIGRETAVDHSGGHMRHTYQNISRKTSQENTGDKFWGIRDINGQI